MASLQDEFDAITAGLVLAEPDDIVAIDYQAMPDVELLDLYAATRRELSERKELLNPTTLRGTDLGGVYHGCALELRRRHLL